MERTYPGILHMHTEYSNLRIRDCIIRIEDAMAYAEELGHEVIAFTEHDFTGGWMAVEHARNKHPNLKVILGNEIYLCRNGLNADNFVVGQDKYYHFILCAKDAEGAKQIREISTRAWMRSYMSRGMRRVPTYYQDLIDIIGANPGHVIGTTACLGGALGTQLMNYHESKSEELYSKIVQWCGRMESIFGAENFYLELQPSESKEQTLVNRYLIRLADRYNYKYIITTDAHYLKKEDAPIHKAYLNAQDGDREVDSFYATTYMMNTAELESHMDLTEEELIKAYDNIRTIAAMCEHYSLKKELKIPALQWKPSKVGYVRNCWIERIPSLKKFVESDYEGDRLLACHIVERLEDDDSLWGEAVWAAVEDNLDKTWESSLVNKTHWSAYFLNLQRIIDVCWEAGTLVGCGRGSGVGFILLYILGITQINPLAETVQTHSFRFLNPSRVSVLD